MFLSGWWIIVVLKSSSAAATSEDASSDKKLSKHAYAHTHTPVHSLFFASFSPKASSVVMASGNLDRKLIVLLMGCKDLPGHRATGVNDAYVSLKVCENYDRVRHVQPSPSPPGHHHPDIIGSVVSSQSAAFTAFGSGTDDSSSTNHSPPGLGSSTEASVASFHPHSSGAERRASACVAFTQETPQHPAAGQLTRRQSLRRSNNGRRGSATGLGVGMHDEDPAELEHVAEMLDGQKYQSNLVMSTCNPEFGQVFVFDHLQIPLKRRSSSVMLNNTITGGSDPSVARQVSADRHKLNCKYSLRIDVMDTTTSKGLGERFCYADVPLDDLPQGKRTTLWVPLVIDETVDNIIRAKTLAMESLDGLVDSPDQLQERIARYQKFPKIGLVFEPVNFGVLPESIRGETTAQALWRALQEELGNTFSTELLKKTHEILLQAEEADIATFEREDVVEILLELYFFTGTDAPADADLVEEVQYLMALFDRSPAEGVNVSELCGVLKMSKWAALLRPRWLVGRKLTVVSTTSIAGALWEPGRIPPPFEYAGFRRTNGAVYERTKRPAPSKLPLYASKPYVNLYNELYANEEAKKAREDLERLAREEEEETRLAKLREAGLDDSVPMFVPKSDRNRRYTADREERSLAMLFAPPRNRGAQDEDLPSTFFDRIQGNLVEYARLQLCDVKDCHIVGSRIVGGRFVNCSFESCLIEQGAEIVDATAFRCCDVTQSRITGSETVNCRMAYTTLRECPLVAQCSLFSCDLQVKSVVVQTYLKECTLDPTVRDEGSNKFDVCRFLEKPRASLMDQMLQDHEKLAEKLL